MVDLKETFEIFWKDFVFSLDPRMKFKKEIERTNIYNVIFEYFLEQFIQNQIIQPPINEVFNRITPEIINENITQNYIISPLSSYVGQVAKDSLKLAYISTQNNNIKNQVKQIYNID